MERILSRLLPGLLLVVAGNITFACAWNAIPASAGKSQTISASANTVNTGASWKPLFLGKSDQKSGKEVAIKSFIPKAVNPAIKPDEVRSSISGNADVLQQQDTIAKQLAFVTPVIQKGVFSGSFSSTSKVGDKISYKAASGDEFTVVITENSLPQDKYDELRTNFKMEYSLHGENQVRPIEGDGWWYEDYTSGPSWIADFIESGQANYILPNASGSLDSVELSDTNLPAPGMLVYGGFKFARVAGTEIRSEMGELTGYTAKYEFQGESKVGRDVRKVFEGASNAAVYQQIKDYVNRNCRVDPSNTLAEMIQTSTEISVDTGSKGADHYRSTRKATSSISDFGKKDHHLN